MTVLSWLRYIDRRKLNIVSRLIFICSFTLIFIICKYVILKNGIWKSERRSIQNLTTVERNQVTNSEILCFCVFILFFHYLKIILHLAWLLRFITPKLAPIIMAPVKTRRDICRDVVSANKLVSIFRSISGYFSDFTASAEKLRISISKTPLASTRKRLRTSASHVCNVLSDKILSKVLLFSGD